MNTYIQSILKGILIGSIAVFIASTVKAQAQNVNLYDKEEYPQAYCMALNIYYEARGNRKPRSEETKQKIRESVLATNALKKKTS